MSSPFADTSAGAESAHAVAPNHRPEHPAHASAVSWGAILAGAAAAAALSMILLILGAGLGLSAISPWARSGVSAAVFGVSSIVWVTVTQFLASGMGGYLAGRLRARWVSAESDEVYFRDTAHGFLAWAVASLATAALLSSALASIVGSGVQAGAGLARGAATAAAGGAAAAAANSSESDGPKDSANYFVDALFRKDAGSASAGASPVATDTSAAPSAEITRILLNSLRAGALPPDDTRYVAQVVAQRTGLSPADAEKRVTDTYARMQAKLRDAETAAREAADKARKATIYASLWLFVSMLIGAFTASLAATWGGRQRDL